MTAEPYAIVVDPDLSSSRSFEQRFYHAQEPLLRGANQYLCEYGEDPDKPYAADRLTPKGRKLVQLLYNVTGIRRVLVYAFHIGIMKGTAFDWAKIEPTVIASMLFAIKEGERFVAAVRYHLDIPADHRVTSWSGIDAVYAKLCREAGITPPEKVSLRSIDLDSPGVDEQSPPEVTSEQ